MGGSCWRFVPMSLAGIAIAALVISFSLTASAQGGAVAGAVERNVAKRLVSRTGAVALTAAERAALNRLWRQADQEALRRIEAQFGAQIGAKRLAQAGTTPAIIAERDAFDRALRRAEPAMSDQKRKEILGYYFDEKLFVQGHHPQMLTTLAHERLHQLSHPKFREAMGSKVNEGITESYARRIHPIVPIKGDPPVYLPEQRVVQMLEGRVADRHLAAAYFRGEIGALRRQVDGSFGAGTFDRFAAAARSGELDRAEAILQAAARP